MRGGNALARQCRVATIHSLITLALALAPACRAPNGEKRVWAESRFARCNDNSTTRPAPNERTTAQPSIDSDSRLSRETATLPGGFGGMFAENGRTVVLLVDTSQRARAIEVLRHLSGLPAPFEAQAVLREARWTFQDLVAWHQHVAVESGIPEIRASSIDEACNCIVIGAADEPGRVAVLRRLTKMNVPCRLVAVEIVGTPRAL
jgi:hypothetical protein